MAPILTMYLEVGGRVLDAMLLAQPQAGVDAVGVVRLQVEVVETCGYSYCGSRVRTVATLTMAAPAGSRGHRAVRSGRVARRSVRASPHSAAPPSRG